MNGPLLASVILGNCVRKHKPSADGSLRFVRAGCYEYGNDPKRKGCGDYCPHEQLSSPETGKRGVQNLSETDIQAGGLDLNGIQGIGHAVHPSLAPVDHSVLLPGAPPLLSLKCAHDVGREVGVREFNALRCTAKAK